MIRKNEIAATEKNILKAARDAFVQKGFAGTRMQEIADNAGINKALLHYYFRNKEKLFERILQDNMQMVIPQLIDALETKGSVRDKLHQLVDNYINVLVIHPDIPLFLIAEMAQKRSEAIEIMKEALKKEGVMHQFLEQIRNDQASGQLRTMPAEQMLLSVMSLLIFPFIARPVFMNIFNFRNKDFDTMMEERRKITKEMIDQSFVIS